MSAEGITIEDTIYLSPGTHELCLQTGDGAHVALDATAMVTVEVGITDRDLAQRWRPMDPRQLWCRHR